MMIGIKNRNSGIIEAYPGSTLCFRYPIPPMLLVTFICIIFAKVCAKPKDILMLPVPPAQSLNYKGHRKILLRCHIELTERCYFTKITLKTTPLSWKYKSQNVEPSCLSNSGPDCSV